MIHYQSLTELASWLKKNVEFRLYAENEIQNSKIQNSNIGAPDIGAPEWLKSILRGQPILTDLWEERSVDVGTYLGALFEKKYPFLKWAFSSEPSGYFNFQQPILLHPSGHEFPELIVAGTYMLGLQRPRDPAQELLSLRKRWEKHIEEDWRNASRRGQG